MEANYDYYEIDIADIWRYEQSLFLYGKSSEEFVRNLFPKIEDLIIVKGEPFLSITEYDKGDEEYKHRFNYYFNDFRETIGNFKNRYRLDYFFTNDYCFQYNQSIVIDSSNDDFDFWFTYKLRQFDTKLIYLNNFLSFQLESNFNGDLSKLLHFLKAITLQYKNELLSERIIELVVDWIKNQPNNIEFKKQNDFVNDKVIDDKLVLNFKYDISLLFKALQPYFDQEHIEKLYLLLNEQEIEDKICFNSNGNQFVMVFRQLHLNQQIIGRLAKTEKWICKYFTYCGQNKKHSNFNPDNVHKILTRRLYDIPKAKRISILGIEYIKLN